MIRQLRTALMAMAFMTVVFGVGYPLVVTGVTHVAFDGEANGSLVTRGGQVVGSSLVGQRFTLPQYFHSRPSAAGDGDDATASAATNLGPSNEDLLATIATRTSAYRAENGLAADAPVPGDAVTASASGLDPEISLANARLQVDRVAAARRVPADVVRQLIDGHIDGRSWGFLGDPGVNVLQLNVALDGMPQAASDQVND